MPRSPARAEAVPAARRLSLRLELRNAVGAPVDPGLLRKVARRALGPEGLVGPHLLAVHLLDDEGLREVNLAQRGIDAPTDVLSFPLLPRLQPGEHQFALPPDAPHHLGDVLVSYDRASAQAAEYGHSVERELCYLLVHGVLHLLGYDHVVADEQRLMRQKEEAVLGPLGLAR
jgi:probable rRNA maturation factor